ncbi:MAG: hypothetical protein ACIRZ6_07180, partial [Limosilactobacillus mucosae]
HRTSCRRTDTGGNNCFENSLSCVEHSSATFAIEIATAFGKSGGPPNSSVPSNQLKLNCSKLISMATRKTISINQTSAIAKTEGNKKTASVAERRELDIT